MIANLTPAKRDAFLRHWPNWRRDEQALPAGVDWYVWLILAGRGWGKTRTGAEGVRELIATGRYERFALIGQTVADVRDVMIQGESGLLACYPKSDRPVYVKSERIVKFSNGAIASTYSGDEPEQLRGPQHHGGWVDELAKMRYAKMTWDMFMFGLRLGAHQAVIVTTTPRPTPIIKELVKNATGDCIIIRGSTFSNKDNLPKKFVERLIVKYDGTRIGRQEIGAEILEDNPNALWNIANLEKHRVDACPPLAFVVVGVDPQGTHRDKDHDEADETTGETGIVGGGVGPCNRKCRNPDLCTGHLYVVGDASTSGSPGEWGQAAVDLATVLQADRVTAETNFGGDMVIHVLNGIDPNMPTKTVRASRSKVVRAEPIANLFAQGRAHMVGCFPGLEDELTNWQPGMPSPNRLDALVWMATDLFFDGDDGGETQIIEYYQPVRISSI